MTQLAGFDTFIRKAFGADPNSIAGQDLGALAIEHDMRAGDLAQIDHNKGHIAYVFDGATKLAACASQQRNQIVAFHFTGDIISIPRDGLHSFSLAALRPTKLLTFPARRFVESASRDERMAEALLECQRRSLRRCRDTAVSLGKKNANERLCGFLASMSERIGTDEDGRRMIDLAMSRRDIGDSLGLTIETVSRQLGSLRDSGLIETVGRSKILLLDEGEIARMAGHFEGHGAKKSSLTKIDLNQCAQRGTLLARPAKGVSS